MKFHIKTILYENLAENITTKVVKNVWQIFGEFSVNFPHIVGDFSLIRVQKLWPRRFNLYFKLH